MNGPSVDHVRAFLTELQDRVCARLEDLDGRARFGEDTWAREQGGGGRTRVLAGGPVIEQAGAGLSHVFGPALPPSASARHPELAGRPFQALGVSVIVHPLNPYAPTSHMNVRFLSAGDVWWFGGGCDLTPIYGFDEDAEHFHRTLRDACAPFGGDVYPRFKRWCDEYFTLPHRREQRGVGGIFFDDLDDWGPDDTFSFVRAVGEAWLRAYLPIVDRRKDTPWSDRERDFQLYRRGRYVEFNLVYDRGTLFGLQSGGRAESILMSLPPLVRWRYGWTPEPGSPEARLTEHFLRPRDWV